MSVVTLSWTSEAQRVELVSIRVRDVLPVVARPGEHWWEVSVSHRQGIPEVHTAAAATWWLAAREVVARILPTAHPDLAATLLLLFDEPDQSGAT